MPPIATVAVFCGAQPGCNPAYRHAASALGEAIARAGMRLVYGGGRVGLMGALADGAVRAGGHVVGVIPAFLSTREHAHEGLTRQIVTDSMHSRKRQMFALADAFVALPGGLGTLDEVVEIITWRQLGLHDKPILLCDIENSTAPLLALLEAAIACGFAHPDTRALFERTEGVSATMARLCALQTGREGEAARL